MSKQANNRLRKELKQIFADPPPHIYVYCDEANMLNWSYLLEGPPDTPYEGGWYWGRLRFPKDFPFGPPSILMVTPNGRFETNQRLCLSMSDYHPESWQPAWSVAAVLKGLLSFMCEEAHTAGAISPPPSHEERRQLAGASLSWNKSQPEFMKAFPEVEKIVSEAVAKRTGATPSAAPDAEASNGIADGAKEAAFAAGVTVRIVGLQSRSDLNGRQATVQPGDTRALESQRVCVRVVAEEGANEEVVSVKPENLELV
mmetsp:Transcript_41693/g.75719  ORF Transcript_41693/g.75719 Transcript_41693/m.75719 type:complete len:257 (-) Transcript_41693:98-868(-)